MDGEMPNTSTPQNTPAPQNKKGLGTLAFLEIGIFEIVSPRSFCGVPISFDLKNRLNNY